MTILPLGGRRILTPALGRGWQRAGGGFVPTDIAGCKLWIDFSDPTTLFTDAGSTPVSGDGDAIYQANDKSREGNNVTQSSSGNRPLYKTGIQNGLSIGRFDGANDYLGKSAFQFVDSVNGEWTVYVIAKRTKTQSDVQYVVCQDNETAWGDRVAQNIRFDGSGDNSYLTSIAFDTNVGTVYSVTYSQTYTDFVLIGIVCSTSQIEIYANGTATGSPTSVTGTLNTAAELFTIGGGRINSGGTEYFGGDICEVVGVSNAISESDRNSLTTYLNNKWAIY